ncbi:MAG: ATP synthase subunit I [Kofleriaceae bacterium]
MASPSIRRIERLNYGLSAGLTLACLVTQTRAVTLGLAIGAGLTCLNFYVLRRLIVKWTTEAAEGSIVDPSRKRSGGGNSALLMLPKMVGLMGACTVAILFLPIDAIAFAVGYSIFIVSIMIEAIYSALRPDPRAVNADPYGPNPAPTDENRNG